MAQKNYPKMKELDPLTLERRSQERKAKNKFAKVRKRAAYIKSCIEQRGSLLRFA